MEIVEVKVRKLKKLASKKKKIQPDFDGAWKQVLKKYFKEFIQFCWPEVYEQIDWTTPHRFLEKEFQSLSKKGKIGKKLVDKLVEVHLKDGSNLIVLIHVEVEGSGKNDFPERIFIYRYSIFNEHKKPIATLAILIDGSPTWRPNVYETECWGSHLRLEYPILKILDFKERKTELEQSKNPFAVVILAQLEAIETAGNEEARLISKFAMTRWLYSHGLPKDVIVDLLLFLSEIMILKKENFRLQYQYQVKELEKELEVSYMTYDQKLWELEGIEQGIEQGIERGLAQGIRQGEGTLLLELLKSKFLTVPAIYVQKIANASQECLLAWGLRLLNSHSIDEVFEDVETNH